MSRSVPLQPFCAFLALTGTTLTFLLNSRLYTVHKRSSQDVASSMQCFWVLALFVLARSTALWLCWFVCMCMCVCVYCARWLSSDGYFLFNVTAADPNAWRLGRIEEGDHETPVWNEMWSVWTSDWWYGCVRTKTVHVRTEFKYNTQDDDSLFQSLSLPYNSSKMSLHYVTVMHCATFSYYVNKILRYIFSSVLFQVAVSCWDSIALVMNEWVWNIGGMIPGRGNWSTWRETSPNATFSTKVTIQTDLGLNSGFQLEVSDHWPEPWHGKAFLSMFCLDKCSNTLWQITQEFERCMIMWCVWC